MVSFTGACPISAREGEAKFWITLYFSGEAGGGFICLGKYLFWLEWEGVVSCGPFSWRQWSPIFITGSMSQDAKISVFYQYLGDINGIIFCLKVCEFESSSYWRRGKLSGECSMFNGVCLSGNRIPIHSNNQCYLFHRNNVDKKKSNEQWWQIDETTLSNLMTKSKLTTARQWSWMILLPSEEGICSIINRHVQIQTTINQFRDELKNSYFIKKIKPAWKPENVLP